MQIQFLFWQHGLFLYCTRYLFSRPIEEQAGFIKGRSITDQIYTKQESTAKYWEFNISFYCLPMDFANAYNRLNQRREKYGNNSHPK